MRTKLARIEPFTARSERSRRFLVLFAAAVLTVILWRIPGGNYVLYPFTILATWFHETAHGLAALLLGGGFRKLVIYPDGAGIAYFTGPLAFGALGMALVAAAGPLGPPIAGAGLIISSRSPRAGRYALMGLGIFMLFTAIVWVRSLFGLIAVPSMALIVLAIAAKAPPHIQAFTVQFLGVQACVSTYYQLGYLFSASAGPLGMSDTAQMQQALLLPYWFWGTVIAIVSFLILWQSLRYAYRSN